MYTVIAALQPTFSSVIIYRVKLILQGTKTLSCKIKKVN